MISSDLVFQVLRDGCVCTDARGCQGCHPDVTVLVKPVMDDHKLGKSGVAFTLWCAVDQCCVRVRPRVYMSMRTLCADVCS